MELELNTDSNGLGQKWKEGQVAAKAVNGQVVQQQQQHLPLALPPPPPAYMTDRGRATTCDLDTPPESPKLGDSDNRGANGREDQGGVLEGEDRSDMQLEDLFGVLLGPAEGHEAGLLLHPSGGWRKEEEEGLIRRGQVGQDEQAEGRCIADPEKGEGGT